MYHKKIIVTGGLGFIGFNLVKKLINLNYFVIIIDKSTYAANTKYLDQINKKKYVLYKLDINSKKILDILKKHKPKILFNLAAETHVDRSIKSPKNFIDSNIVGVFNLLETLKFYNSKNSNKIKLIHVSTDEVYGDIAKNKYSKEIDRYFPSSPYSASKASSDLLIFSYFRTYNFPGIVTNCCNNFGPYQNVEKLIPKLIRSIKNNSPMQLYGRGTNEREWIYVEDHCDALIKIMKKGKLGEQYNIGTGVILNNLKIANFLLKTYNLNSKIKSRSIIKFIKDRPGHDKRYALNSNKISNRIKWKPKVKFKIGIEKTIKWYTN